ncbi:MAG: NADH-quinone oxidoreductase subunit N [Planctomycetia bacterium]|nr:NADH-quinone oxidoreductase subunit N [Planctomycetia bacterium]
MSLSDLINQLVIDTLGSTAAFRGELVLCGTIVLILLSRVFNLTSRVDSFYVTLAGSAVALYLAGPWLTVEPVGGSQQLFTGLLVYDSFTIYFRTLLFFFAVLFAVFTRISGVPDRDAAPDVYTLVLGATLGMCLMASSNHLLMVFLSVEMASVPSYALAGILKGRRQSSEAALKYAVYGAGTAGIMLYGISLLAGVLGSMHLPTMGVRLAELLQAAKLLDGTNMVLALGGLMILVGIAFKLSAVPFHFWCPDVFEGASAEVNAFLSVASKAAALALLARVAIGFGSIAVPAVPATQVAMFSVSEQAATAQGAPSEAAAQTATPKIERSSQIKALAPARDFLARVLAFTAIITCTFGNLAAYGQTNIKRLLAYSTIAQAGYMIMPIPAAMVLAGTNPEAAGAAMAAMAFYAGVYLFMNLGAFAVVAFLRNALNSEDIADYAGLIRRCPIVVVCFSVILFSLIGLPPLAGFNGKLLIFSSLVEAKLWTVLVIGGLNTAISLYYYLRVVKIMTIDPEPENRIPVSLSFIPGTYVAAITLPLVVLGIWWNNLNQFALSAAAHLF